MTKRTMGGKRSEIKRKPEKFKAGEEKERERARNGEMRGKKRRLKLRSNRSITAAAE